MFLIAEQRAAKIARDLAIVAVDARGEKTDRFLVYRSSPYSLFHNLENRFVVVN
jgi:hypothetical protein